MARKYQPDDYSGRHTEPFCFFSYDRSHIRSRITVVCAEVSFTILQILPSRRSAAGSHPEARSVYVCPQPDRSPVDMYPPGVFVGLSPLRTMGHHSMLVAGAYITLAFGVNIRLPNFIQRTLGCR